MSDKGVFAFVETRVRPWKRTGSTFMAGDPPHGEREYGRVAVSTIWADAQHEIPLAVTDADGCVAVILGDLDAAWAEAEAALPEGWIFGVLARGDQYLAEAWEDDEAYASGDSAAEAYADTPAAALRALAAKLRERADGEVWRCTSIKPGTDLRCMRTTGHHEPHQNTTLPAVESEWERAG